MNFLPVFVIRQLRKTGVDHEAIKNHLTLHYPDRYDCRILLRDWYSLTLLARKKSRNPNYFTGKRTIVNVSEEIETSLPIIANEGEVYFVKVLHLHNQTRIFIDFRRWDREKVDGRYIYTPTMEGLRFELKVWKKLLKHLTHLLIKWSQKSRKSR